MDDVISRAAALALAKDICVPTKDGTVYRHRCIDPQQIMDLPSAQSKTCEYWDGESNFCALHRPSAQQYSLDEWCDTCKEYDSEKHCCPRYNRVIRDALKMRKRGKWIPSVDRWGDIITTVDGYTCSGCGSFNADKDNFCPNCGADMRGEEDGKNS